MIQPKSDWPLRINGQHLCLDKEGQMWLRVDMYPLPTNLKERKELSGVVHDPAYSRSVFLGIAPDGRPRTLIAYRNPVIDLAVPPLPEEKAILVDLTPVWESTFDLWYYTDSNKSQVPWPESNAVVETKKWDLGTQGLAVLGCRIDRQKSEFYQALKTIFAQPRP